MYCGSDGRWYYGGRCSGGYVCQNGDCVSGGNSCQAANGLCGGALECCSGICSSGVCSNSGGAGLTIPTCTLRFTELDRVTPKANPIEGRRLDFVLDMGDNGDAFLSGGTVPTVSGVACNGATIVGWCGSGNLCPYFESQGLCADVCVVGNNSPLYVYPKTNGTCTVTATVVNGAGSSQCSASITVDPDPSPNLVVTNLVLNPSTVVAGGTVDATAVVTNVGITATSGSFKVAINRNANSLSCTSGTKDDEKTVLTVLNPNQSTTVNLSFTAPASLGTKTAIALVDSYPFSATYCQIPESNENDNTRRTTYDVIAQPNKPDLIITGLDIPDGTVSQWVNTTMMVQNNGNVDVAAGSYIVAVSRNNIRFSGGCNISSYQTNAGNPAPALPAGGPAVPVTIPLQHQSGIVTNKVGSAMIDSNLSGNPFCDIDESNETNNTTTDTYSVTSPVASFQTFFHALGGGVYALGNVTDNIDVGATNKYISDVSGLVSPGGVVTAGVLGGTITSGAGVFSSSGTSP